MTEKSNEVRKAAVQVISYLLKGVDTDLLQVMIIIFLPYLTLNPLTLNFQIHGLTSLLFQSLSQF